MDESEEDWAIQKGFDSRVVLPFTLEMVEKARNRQDYFTRAQVHDVILRCWNTLKTRLKDEGASVVCVDITHSRPWQKVIAAASDKIRSKLVGPGICSCHLEMDAKRINPHNNLPHPNFVLTHGNGVEDVEVLYHPGKQKDSSMAVVFRIEGEEQFEAVEPSKDDINLAFRLATKGKDTRAWKNNFASMIQSFKAESRPNGWEPTYDFQIGAHVWAWVLSEELKCALHGWLGQGTKGVKRKIDDAEHDLTKPKAQIQLNVDDEVEDGVRISNAIFAQGDDLPLQEALDRSHVQYNSRFVLQAPEQNNNQKSVFCMFFVEFFPRQIDESNSGIREAHLGQRSLEVKVEPPEVAIVIVPCAQLRFTQCSCGAKFRGGPYANKHLNDFIQDLISKGPKESCKLILKETWLVLDIMKYNGGLRSIDNRRLHCLKEYQKYLQDSGSSETVRVRVRIHHWTEEHDRYVNHNDTRNGGTDIKVRGRW